jgi:hypothetical protein
MPKVTDLEPVDRNQCQADIPNKTWSFMALGPADENKITGEKRGGSRQVDRFWRCRAKPVCIVQENKPGKDGICGEMSLCADCFVKLFLQDPTRASLKEKLVESGKDSTKRNKS